MLKNNKLDNITSAPAYLRKSRAENDESIADVLSRHRASLEEIARIHGIVINEYYEEVVSGESLYARPEMLRLLEGIETGRYRAVLCMDIDRLGRGGMRDQGIILDTFRQSETLIITPDKIYDLSNDDDEEMTEFKAFFARREYKMIRKRMSRGLIRTIMEGGYVANAPYGYKKAQKGKLPSLEIEPDEAKIVEYIFKRYLDGTGSTTIAEEVNLMGVKPNRSNEWTRNSIRCILKNPTYCGLVPWNRVKRVAKDGKKTVAQYMPKDEWILATGKHDAIISRETYDKAQEIRSQRTIPSKRLSDYVSNPMSGLIKCSKCGNNMQMMGKSKGVPYILCNKKGCCAGAKAEYVENALIVAIRKEADKLKLDMLNDDMSRIDNISAMIDATAKEIDKFKQRRTSLFEFLEDGTYSRAEFIERKNALENSISQLTAKLEELEKKRLLILGEDKQRLINQVEYVLSVYDSEDAASKNKLLKSIMSHAHYSKEKKTKPNDFMLVVHLRLFL